MQKTLLAGALVLWSAVVAGVLWNLERASHVGAAQLAPAEALLVAEFPNLPSTALRWKDTALYEILAEPELRAFLSKPVPGMAPGGEGADALERLKRAKPRQAFLAVASLEDNLPHAVAGLEFAGDRRELEPLISHALIRAQNTNPQGTIRRFHYRGHQVIAFDNHGITLAGCFAKNWYFVANDVDLLKATLDRLSGSSHPALARTVNYQVSQLALPPRADFRLFVQTPSPASRLLARFTGQPGPAAKPTGFVCAALASRIEGHLIHDTLVVRLRGETARTPSLSGHTLALTTQDTLFYGALAPQLESWFNFGATHSNRLIPTLLAALTPPGKPDIARFQAAFGPEHALLLDWPRPSPQPGLFLASEIRDPAQARRFTEALFRSWDRADANGVSMWTFSLAQPALFHPAVALAGHHLVAGLSSESLRPFAQHAVHPPQQKGETLERSAVFRSSMGLLARPETALAYLDSAALFERVYVSLRPAAAIWGPGIPWMNRYADFDRLPSPQAVSRHLSPITLTAHQAEEGLVIDTVGPVSFVELAAGMSLGAFYAAVPALKPPNPNPQSILPPPSPKPLSAPSPAADFP